MKVLSSHKRNKLRLKEILQSPLTMHEIVEEISVNKRTIYRYMRDLNEEGHNVVRIGIKRPTQYQIVQISH